MKALKKVRLWLYAMSRKQKLKEKLTFAMTANPLNRYQPSKFSDAEIQQMEKEYQHRKAQAFWA